MIAPILLPLFSLIVALVDSSLSLEWTVGTHEKLVSSK